MTPRKAGIALGLLLAAFLLWALDTDTGFEALMYIWSQGGG